ncbi:MAG: hypothetical protein KatS3mg011_2363 [Acidimicrobiia bacterium]|nr:MAG: hypothetical protein KatS3mg011_2363 [Acidimicrobiia bacterium]
MSSDITPGTEIPPWHVAAVPAEKMKVMALILSDPNPIHWDVEAVRRLGLGESPINQGPTNQAYVINALLAWLGDPTRLRSLQVRFQANVYAGEAVTAGGRVEQVRQVDGERLAYCRVWLRKGDGTEALAGTAVVRA